MPNFASEHDDQRFRPEDHLRSRADFSRVFAGRCSASDEIMVVYVCANQLDRLRLGISVSRRIGNAVKRNYVRRRFREAFRLGRIRWPGGYDILCVARADAVRGDSNIPRSLDQLVGQAVKRYCHKRKA